MQEVGCVVPVRRHDFSCKNNPAEEGAMRASIIALVEKCIVEQGVEQRNRRSRQGVQTFVERIAVGFDARGLPASQQGYTRKWRERERWAGGRYAIVAAELHFGRLLGFA